MSPTALDILSKYWGYNAFREPQDRIIESVVSGIDTLALMPTGGGKSICYQVPALMGDGITIVISPLIALMKDQVYQLKKRNIQAEAIYSGMHYNEIDRIFSNCVYGNVKLLYISPERLKTRLAEARIRQMKVDLLAIDEAHCISQWGYDFRPAYMEIFNFREWHPEVPFLALTATATPRVINDIQERLQFSKKHVIRSSFYRSNLAYVVSYEEDKRSKLLDILNKIQGSGIVYAHTRRMCKEIAVFLRQHKFSVDYYHAGLDRIARSQKQDDWISGKTRIIVATNAFGMGIDHPHVRLVVHLQPPPNLEAYFQEAGRAGRDGQKAFSVLIYNEYDLTKLDEFFESSYPNITEIRSVYQGIGSYHKIAYGVLPEDSIDFDLVRFAAHYQLNPMMVLNALRILQENNYLYVTEAVFVPSKLVFNVNKEEFYNHLLTNPEDAELMRTLLRIYQGIFDQETSIDEYKLASFLKISRDNLVQKLNKLSQLEIIRYVPSKDAPQLVFLTPRIQIEGLVIDMVQYRNLKQWRRSMLDAVIRFVKTPQCRSQLLLQYFGEDISSECRICDVCVNKQKQSKSQGIELQDLNKQIIQVIQNQGCTFKELKHQLKSYTEDSITKGLQFLIDEEVIYFHKSKYYLSEFDSIT